MTYMSSYDIKCPVCGTVNHNLYLEETDGWMECEKCGACTQSLRFRKEIKIPCISIVQLTEVMKAAT